MCLTEWLLANFSLDLNAVTETHSTPVLWLCGELSCHEAGPLTPNQLQTARALIWHREFNTKTRCGKRGTVAEII
jgi:hypothetical protein